MRVGTVEHDGETFLLHLHIVPATSHEAEELIAFRGQLRGNPELIAAYVAAKQRILAAGGLDSVDYAEAKGSFNRGLGYRGADDG